MKTFFSISVLILFLGCSASTPTKNGVADSSRQLTEQDACNFDLLIRSCVSGTDRRAPAMMRQGGEAACFTGQELAKEFPSLNFQFSSLIDEHELDAEDAREETEAQLSCIHSSGDVRNCDIGYINALAFTGKDACGN